MKDMNSNFGLLIAYALPGFVAIWGLSGIWPAVIGCANGAGACDTVPSLVGFLNSTVAAIAAGMAVSAIRFVVIDEIHERTGLRRPRWNGVALQNNLAAVRSVVDHHYRYYQFHANMIVAGVIAYEAHLYDARTVAGLTEVLLVALAVVFWITSRDNLRKYYQNLDAIFDTQPKGRTTMSNGMSNEHDGAKAGRKEKDKKGAKPNDRAKRDNSGKTPKAPAPRTR